MVGAITWVTITEAMLDAGTEITQGSTVKSYSVTSDVMQFVFLAIGSLQGIRECSGRSMAIADILPDYDRDLHDIVVLFDQVAGTSATHGIFAAIAEAPGATADGVGIFVTSQRASCQSTLTCESSGLDADLEYVRALFTLRDDRVSGAAWRYTTALAGWEGLTKVAAANSDLLVADNARLFVGCGTYTGTALEDDYVEARIRVGYVDRFPVPT